MTTVKGNPTERTAAQKRSPASFGSSYGSLPPGPCAPAEVNRRDLFGRTVLHLLCASDDPAALDYLQLLLTHPSVNCNLQDQESGWTALHRALYAGNLHIALLLLERANIDTRIRDYEGLTAFDLYNTTVPGTCPRPEDAQNGGLLFVWGGNRNYNLGLGHANDHGLAERLKLPPPKVGASARAGSRFDRPLIRDMSFSRWHTVLATNEARANVYVCGIGTHGRLGRMPQTQPTLERLQDWNESAQCVIAAPDHTVLVTTSGAVYTLGLNRMAPLGYVVEEGLGTVASSSGTHRSHVPTGAGASIGLHGAELDVQVTPRRVLGPLKKECVLGAAASRLHTAVFTADALYTWGTNNGQLGYDRHAAPVQVQPRRVTLITAPIRQVVASDFATACLLESSDVVVLHGDAHFRVTFPSPQSNVDPSLFRPRQTHPKPTIRKLTCSGTMFAALSELGDLFTFTLEHPSTTGAKVVPPRPQLVWSVRRKFSAVRDVAIGSEGSLILCTADGHVYVRERRIDMKSKARAKFQAVPYLQRIVRVTANETGSYAALQAPSHLAPMPVHSPALEDELRQLAPALANPPSIDDTFDHSPPSPDSDSDSDSESLSSSRLRRAGAQARAILQRVSSPNDFAALTLSDTDRRAGCDALLLVEHGMFAVPVHRLLVAVRVPHLAQALWHGGSANDTSVSCDKGVWIVRYDTLSLLSALFLVLYLYTDDVPPVWSASISHAIAPLSRECGISPAPVRAELLACTTSWHLDALHAYLERGLASSPMPTLHTQFAALFAKVAAHAPLSQLPDADVVLHLADMDVACHSLFLRRSPMLQSVLDWHHARGASGPVEVDMHHWTWPVVRVGLMYLYTDADVALFQHTDEDKSPDQFIDFILDVLQLADELLLTRLQLISLTFLAPRVHPTNLAALLTDALCLNAPPFTKACMDYATRHLEMLLERGCLATLAAPERMRLTAHIQNVQDAYMRRSLARDRLFALTLKHQDYVAELDLPKPSLQMACLKVPKRLKSPKVVPVELPPPSASPAPPDEDSLLFAMDDVAPAPPKVPPAPAWQTVGSRPPQRPRRSGPIPPAPTPPIVSPPDIPRLAVSESAVPRWGTSPPTPAPALPRVTPQAQSVFHMPVAPKVSQKERKRQQQTQRPSVPTVDKPAWSAKGKGRAEAWGMSPVSSPSLGAASTPPPLSFAQIQAQQERDLSLELAQQHQPKSFAQILHEEEHVREREERERSEAEAFERWFEEESRRVQQQQASQRSERRSTPRRGKRRGKPNPATARIDD